MRRDQGRSSQSEQLAAMVRKFNLGRDLRVAGPRDLVARSGSKPALVKPAASRKPKGKRDDRAAHPGIALRAEDIIPMEGDPAFKEF
jgi:hypothetical protein